MMKCPVCSSVKFYIKDPDDEYETYGFEYKDGTICFDAHTSEPEIPEIDEGTETFCDKCSWHGKLTG
ncbi:hypothetical protein ACFLYZ_00935 [Thermodesulfobacteriota bacterium]